MSHIENPPQKVIDTVQFLADLRQDPREVDRTYELGTLAPHTVTMTSIGWRRKAHITPFYPGIQFKMNSAYRYLMARAYKRPLVEANIGYNRQLQMATVVLRLALKPYEDASLLETAWQFPLCNADVHEQTTEGIISRMRESAAVAEPINSRSGFVELTPNRLQSGNWTISDHVPADYAVLAIANSAREHVSYNRL